MKVLIVFTTPNTNGSGESYEDTWDCIDEINEHREKDIDDGDKIYVFNGIDFRKPNNGWDYNALCPKLNKIKQCYANASFIVLFHADEMELMELKQKCNYSDIIFKKYSTTDDDIWHYISMFCNDQQNEAIKDKFIKLWKHLKTEYDLAKIHSLRVEILSPLVALDLIKQAEANGTDVKIDENMKNKVKNAISDLINNDEKQKKDPINDFCQLIEYDSFLEKLEKLVKCGRSSLEINRGDLEDVAKEMEKQIAALNA